MSTRLQRIAEAVHEELADRTVAMVVGREEAETHNGRRRVMWIPGQGKLVPSQRAGGTLLADGTRVVCVWNREEQLSVFIIAERVDTTEVLFENLLAALSEVIPESSMKNPGYRWVTQEKGQAGATLRSQLIEFTFTVVLPVRNELQQLTTITEESVEGELEGEVQG
jgi:hypothetical protein